MTVIELEPLFSEPPTKTVSECMHDDTKGAGHGYAMCGGCGALLPDGDPDLYAKVTGVRA